MGSFDSLTKTLMLGKTEGRRRRGWQRMRWLNSITHSIGFPYSSVGKESTYNAGDLGSIPWFRKIPWKRDRPPTPVFLGFPCGSAAKESACNAGSLGLIPRLGRSPGDRKGLSTPVFWPGEFQELYSPWGHKESDTIERISLSLFTQWT